MDETDIMQKHKESQKRRAIYETAGMKAAKQR